MLLWTGVKTWQRGITKNNSCYYSLLRTPKSGSESVRQSPQTTQTPQTTQNSKELFGLLPKNITNTEETLLLLLHNKTFIACVFYQERALSKFLHESVNY